MSGDAAVTSGWTPARRRLWLLALVVCFSLVQTAINALTRISDLRAAGKSASAWQVAVNEATSLAAWIVCMAILWRLVEWLRPPRFSWPVVVGLHAVASIAVSLVHIALMVGLRIALFRAIDGSHYVFSTDIATSLLYEYRKDAISYVLLACTMAAIQWFTRPVEGDANDSEPVLQVNDGQVTHLVPLAEIEWLEAAGNYVTVHWRGRALLHRATLAGMERELAGEGMVRIHRSRLVRQSAIRQLVVQSSGDFEVVLDDGTRLRGSRRFRSAVA